MARKCERCGCDLMLYSTEPVLFSGRQNFNGHAFRFEVCEPCAREILKSVGRDNYFKEENTNA